jgi:hypothetical protein
MAAFSENNYAKVNRGETAQFFIYFWNPEEESSPVRVKATEVPEGLSVIITPNDFMLNSSLVTEFPAEKGRNYISTNQGLMMTMPVKVLVKVPKSMKLGGYNLVITATSGNPSKMVSSVLEKKFKFTVDVVTPSFFEKTPTIGKTNQPKGNESLSQQPKGNESLSQRITGMFAAAQSTDFILIIISIIILAFVIWFIRFR